MSEKKQLLMRIIIIFFFLMFLLSIFRKCKRWNDIGSLLGSFELQLIEKLVPNSLRLGIYQYPSCRISSFVNLLFDFHKLTEVSYVDT